MYICMYVCMCLCVCMHMCVGVCVCVGGKGLFVTLQEETAVALCGFFSVPLTMRVGLWKSLSGNQVHDGRSARRQL